MFYLDFETRSQADLKKVGAYEYARHPSTDILCACWAFADGEVDIWHPAFEDLAYKQAVRKVDRTHDDLLRNVPPMNLWSAIKRGELIEAHNAFFERCIWHWVMVKKYGWPEVPHESWRCSAAKASSYALRRKLEHVALDLGVTDQKDMAGHRLMLKMSKPRKPTKGDPDSPWHQKRADLDALFAYCAQDVRTERAVSDQLRPLPPVEQAIFQLDQAINWRGIHCDRPLVDGALKIGAAVDAAAKIELGEITDERVTKVTHRVPFLDWLEEQGVDPPKKFNAQAEYIRTTEAEGIQWLLDNPYIPEHVRRACTIWQAVNKTSTKKYDAIARRMAGDDRVRETLRYHAASTGRWGGLGIQPQNFPRRVPKNLEELCRDVKSGDYELMVLLYGRDNVKDALSGILRGAITAAPGYDLLAADYSAIEARGTFWIAGHKDGLKEFRRLDALGDDAEEDIYTWQASKIYHRRITKADDVERQSGKVAVLGCGYQMGGPKLQSYAASMKIEITEAQAKEIVEVYRRENWQVKQFWWDVQSAAIWAASRQNWGKTMECGRTRWGVRGRFLHCRLPSGRLLSYLDPRVDIVDTDWGQRPQLTFMGVDTYTHQWKRCSTYGGKLTENVVQALCRDIMRDAMLRAEEEGYPIILTVHDEIVSEVPEGEGDLEEFEQLLGVVPDWADDFPIVAKGWRGKRYRK